MGLNFVAYKHRVLYTTLLFQGFPEITFQNAPTVRENTRYLPHFYFLRKDLFIAQTLLINFF